MVYTQQLLPYVTKLKRTKNVQKTAVNTDSQMMQCS